ncbi:hypothetical protein [Rhizobacter sp. P5_C2]
MRRTLAGLLLGLLASWAANAASAAPEGFMVQPDTAALKCLTPAPADRKPIAYPDDARRLQSGGFVRVNLEFRHPDKPPRTTLVNHAGMKSFNDAVEAYVAAYRLPCLREESGTVTATQDFEFTLDDGQPVAWHPLRQVPLDIESDNCRPRFPILPQFPRAALNDGADHAMLLLRMKFRGPTEPPAVSVLYRDAAPTFVAAATRWASGVRMPCLREDQVVTTAQSFRFQWDDDNGLVFKDLGLQQLMRVIDKLDEHHVFFDFNTMGCPFNVRLQLYQPAMENRVGEIGTSDPRRAAFLEWMSRISLKLPAKALSQVLGSSMTVSVPCTQLDLR